jgi:integrase
MDDLEIMDLGRPPAVAQVAIVMMSQVGGIRDLWRKEVLMNQPPRHRHPDGRPIIIDVIAHLLESKRTSGRRLVYIKSLAGYLSRFSKGRERTPIADITTEDIEDWLDKFPVPYSRQTWLNRISTLFSFAVRRGHTPANPCDRIDRVRIDHQPPKILTPEQAELMLRIVPGISRTYLILGLYAGIRPDEIVRLTWADINLETKTVRVDGKTRRRRIVPLEPKTVALLAQCPLRTGPVAPHNTTIRRFKRKAKAPLGLPAWLKDVLRHSAASYLLALHGDAGRVATMLGNSAAILLTHYHEPVSKADCKRFWTV